MAVRKRKKVKRGRKKQRRGYVRRSSQAKRGVAVTLSMTELRKLLAPTAKKKAKKKKGKAPRLSLADKMYAEAVRRAVHDERPPGSKVSDSRCLSCSSRMYERDKGSTIQYYCPRCDTWSQAIAV